MPAARSIKSVPSTAQQFVPPQLVALGLMLEGAESHPDYVVGSLNDALKKADAFFSLVFSSAAKKRNWQAPVQGVIHDGVAKSAEYRKLEQAGADPCGVVSETIDRALWVGIAIAYRYFNGGVR